MKHFFSVYLFIIVFLGNLSAQSSRQAVETGKVIVKLSPDAVPVFEKRLRTLRKATSDTSTLSIGIKSFDRINRRYRSSNMRRVFPDAGEYEAKHREYGLHLWYEITIPEGEDPQAVAVSYGVDENVQVSEPRYRIRSVAMPASPAPLAGTPNDPGFSKQWNYNNTGQTGGTPGADIRLPDAWERIKSMGIKNNNVIVAVMDGGIYYDHEDLKANMWVNQAELNGTKGVDDDANGFKDDIYGYNFVNRTNGVIDPEDHATHVAGTIAAVTNNSLGVSGIAGSPSQGYGIKIMTVQILDGDRDASSIAPAFAYAADNGAVISQNSWGYEKANVYNQTDTVAINYFIKQAGRDSNKKIRPGTPMVGGIVIFAAGNDKKDDKWYPAYFDNVTAVAAVNHYGKLAWYSNFGSWVDISAPGGDTDETGKGGIGGIYSTSYLATNKNYYEYMQGTSMACPHVSGVAALILSVYGNEKFTPDMLRTRLLCSTTPLAGFDPSNVSKMGAGLVNASAALAPGGTPNEVTDLTAQTVNAVSCRLTWTVPQAENNGEVGFYTAACATVNITEANFSQYAQAPVAMTKAAGTAQVGTVTGLQPATTYYVAIRSADNLCHSSVISNVKTFTTRSNSAPVVTKPLPDITLRDVAKETAFYVGNVFTDGDNDAMTYGITVASTRVATARVKGDSILIKPVAAGKTTLTLTADDGNTGRTSSTLSLTVTQNHAPAFSGLLADTTLIPYSKPVVINLSEYTSDPEGDPATFEVEASQSGIVNTILDGSILTIDPRHHGFVTLQITASDPYSAKSVTSIDVTVEQKYAPDKTNQLLVYPNPTSDVLWYSYVLDATASVSIRIVNSIGQIMYQTPNEKLSAGTYYYNIDLSEWGIGMYFVQYFMDGKAVDTKKVVKQ